MESDWSISCERMWYVRYACKYFNLRCCIATSRRRFCRSTLHVFAASSTATNLHNKRGLWVSVFKFYANVTVIFTSFWVEFLGWQIWQHCYSGKESLDILAEDWSSSQVMQQTCYWVFEILQTLEADVEEIRSLTQHVLNYPFFVAVIPKQLLCISTMNVDHSLYRVGW